MSIGRCSLVFGIPVSREEFDRAWSRTPRSDYLGQFIEEPDPQKVWADVYAHIASAADELIQAAASMGAEIYREATLADFSRSTDDAALVILFAHFRGFDFTAQDLLAPLNHIVSRIRGGEHPAFGYFETEFSGMNELIDGLNAAVGERALLKHLPPVLADAGHLSIPVGRVLCRDLLDEAFHGLMKPGNQVDLFDGLHTPGEVEAAISEGFRGELDLALCNSAALATYIDLRRGNRIRHLHWPDLLHPIPQMLATAETLRRFAVTEGSYIRTRLELERGLGQLDWNIDEDNRIDSRKIRTASRASGQ